MFNYLVIIFSSNSLPRSEEYDNIECLDDSAKTYAILKTTYNKSVLNDSCIDNAESSALQVSQENQSIESSDIDTNPEENSEWPEFVLLLKLLIRRFLQMTASR